jgi:hypothetical protein
MYRTRYVKSSDANKLGGDHKRHSQSSGRKNKRKREELEKLRDVPMGKRSTLRSMSGAIDMPASTLWRMVHGGLLVPHNSFVKPMLTDANKLRRIEFALNHIKRNGHISMKCMIQFILMRSFSISIRFKKMLSSSWGS